MLEIDLYKNYNLTVAEIFKEREAAEKEYAYVPREAAKKMSGLKKALIATAVTLPLLALTGVAVIYITDPFYVPPVYAPDVEELAIPKQADPLENFVKIQIIEFEPEDVPETTALPVVARPAPKPAPQPQPQQKPTPSAPEQAAARSQENAAPQTPVRQPAPPAPAPAIPLYVLEISGINRAEFDILSGIAASRGANVNITRDLSVRQLVWRVYAPAAGTGVFVENTEAVRLGEFNNREDAINFAEIQPKDDIIIRAESETEVWYAVEICCMNADDARLSAQESGITDKVFRVLRVLRTPD